MTYGKFLGLRETQNLVTFFVQKPHPVLPCKIEKSQKKAQEFTYAKI